MNVLLVLAEDGALREALRAALPDAQLLLFESNVDAAGRRLVAMRADAILLDDAPGFGAAALSALRAAAPGTPVVVLSSRGDLVTQAAYLRAGARDVIVKPFAFETLRDTLAALAPAAGAGAAPVRREFAPPRDAALSQHQMALRWLGRAARHAGDPGRLAQSLVEAAGDMFDAVRCAVLVERDRHVVVAAAHGVPESIRASLRLSYASGMMRHFDERAALLDRAAASEQPGALQELQLLNAELAAPLLRDGRVFGAIVLGEKASGGPYTAAERELLSLLARSVSVVFEQGARQAAAGGDSAATLLVDGVGVGMAHILPDATIAQINPAGARLLDVDAAALAGRSVQKLGSGFADVVLRAQRGEGDGRARGRVRDMALNAEILVDAARLADGSAAVAFQPAPARAAAPGDLSDSPFWEYLASRVAQEIKNPMVAINTFAQLLPRKYDSEDFRDAYSRVVQREITRINAVVETLFEFARDPKLSLRRVDLNATLEAVIASFEAEFAARAIRLETAFDPEAPEADADPDYLARAVQNVVQNAVDAMPEGGTLRVRTKKGADGTSIEIEDTGPGIGAAAGEALLPFFSTKEQGMGLGLPLANRIVEKHRGALRLLDPGKPGNRVEIHLPPLEKAHADHTGD